MSPPGDYARAQGRYLRGLAWYDLSSARAASFDAAAVVEWNRSVQADYNRYLVDRAARINAKRVASNALQVNAATRVAAARRRWRENPTEDEIRSGVALNALAADLADPAIPAAKWSDARVDLPDDLSIQSLVFRFASAPRDRRPAGVGPSTVAIGRMKVSTRWPIALRRSDLDTERAAYSRGIAAVIDSCAKGKTLRAAEVESLRASVAALKDKLALYPPNAVSMSKQADLFLRELDEATRIFLDREFAEELIRDAEGHRAKTVGELLAFMKKYRLLFSEADQDPNVWATYKRLYDLLRQQIIALNFADAPAPANNDKPPAQEHE